MLLQAGGLEEGWLRATRTEEKMRKVSVGYSFT